MKDIIGEELKEEQGGKNICGKNICEVYYISLFD